MLNRSPLPGRWRAFALALTLAAPAAADLPAPVAPASNRAAPASRPSARPLPSGVRERLQVLKEKRNERLRERKEQRQRIEQLSEDLERSLARADVNTKELKEKMDALMALRTERRREHRLALRTRFGSAVAEPTVRAELALHARRTARLKRLQFVAATERAGKKRSELLARVERLRTKENARHDETMRRLAPSRKRQPDERSEVPAASAAAPAPSGGTP